MTLSNPCANGLNVFFLQLETKLALKLLDFVSANVFTLYGHKLFTNSEKRTRH